MRRFHSVCAGGEVGYFGYLAVGFFPHDVGDGGRRAPEIVAAVVVEIFLLYAACLAVVAVFHHKLYGRVEDTHEEHGGLYGSDVALVVACDGALPVVAYLGPVVVAPEPLVLRRDKVGDNRVVAVLFLGRVVVYLAVLAEIFHLADAHAVGVVGVFGEYVLLSVEVLENFSCGETSVVVGHGV